MILFLIQIPDERLLKKKKKEKLHYCSFSIYKSVPVVRVPARGP